MSRLFYLLLTFLTLLGGIFLWGYAQFVRPGPLVAPATVVIPKGAGLDGIAEALKRAGIIDDALLFRLGARLLGAHKELRAGEYAVPAAISVHDAVVLLRSGKTVVRRFTVAEGLTTSEVLVRLAAAEGLDGRVAAPPDEGRLLPETYHYAWGDAREAMVRRMTLAMEETLAALWAERAEGLPVDSPEEALILASIVERETGDTAERPRVARVFLNRLALGMRLQSDPTVVYALTKGEGPLGRALTRDDLKTPSPYNTYLRAGLPPTPIGNPGRASLEAVLKPAQSDELYFVANGEGGHAFARTLEEHNRNVARWRRIRMEAE